MALYQLLMVLQQRMRESHTSTSHRQLLPPLSLGSNSPFSQYFTSGVHFVPDFELQGAKPKLGKRGHSPTPKDLKLLKQDSKIPALDMPQEVLPQVCTPTWAARCI